MTQKAKLLTLLFLASAFTTSGQINMADSTAQVISYWEKGEIQNYSITSENTRLKGSDTTSHKRVTYEVEITVLDQTDQSYTL